MKSQLVYKSMCLDMTYFNLSVLLNRQNNGFECFQTCSCTFLKELKGASSFAWSRVTKAPEVHFIIYITNSPYNFSIQNRPQNSDRVQLQLQSPRRCIIKHLKHTKLYSIEFLRTDMTSYPSNYHREYSPYGSYSLFQFERSDVISVLKNSISAVLCSLSA